jgi:hypothetical protein
MAVIGFYTFTPRTAALSFSNETREWQKEAAPIVSRIYRFDSEEQNILTL